MVSNISKVAKEKKKAKKPYLTIKTGGVNMQICVRGGGGAAFSLKLRLTPICRLMLNVVNPGLVG